jgi:hypothetical protein
LYGSGDRAVSHQLHILVLPIALIAILAALSGCPRMEDTVAPSVLYQENVREYGRLAVAGAHVLVVENTLGHTIVAGEGLGDSLRWFFDKSVRAETSAEARARLNDMYLVGSRSDDTLFISSVAPMSSERLKFAGLVSMGVPHAMITVLSASGSVLVSDLYATVIVLQSRGVDLLRHKGSFSSSATVEADHVVEMVLPPGGFCRIQLVRGDIVMRIPASTSATVVARAGGSIIPEGLQFSNPSWGNGVFTGTLGSGDGDINVETQNGSITMRAF